MRLGVQIESLVHAAQFLLSLIPFDLALLLPILAPFLLPGPHIFVVRFQSTVMPFPFLQEIVRAIPVDCFDHEMPSDIHRGEHYGSSYCDCDCGFHSSWQDLLLLEVIPNVDGRCEYTDPLAVVFNAIGGVANHGSKEPFWRGNPSLLQAPRECSRRRSFSSLEYKKGCLQKIFSSMGGGAGARAGGGAGGAWGGGTAPPLEIKACHSYRQASQAYHRAGVQRQARGILFLRFFERGFAALLIPHFLTSQASRASRFFAASVIFRVFNPLLRG